MLTLPDLARRLKGLIADLDGDLWTSILQQVNPPASVANPAAIHDLAFRDAKALTGYAPDLRAIIKKTAPKSLTAEELAALIAIRGLYHLMARLPVLLLTIPEHLTNDKLIDLYNGYRQILVELDDYLALAKAPGPDSSGE
ncbi:MAG: hypothetical protein LBT86_00655 [Deltaproteobacteria bacterium]|jgi:hypothetical protein|nr:hypothetical protein [Deltaproteobacteria bacterium]